MNGPFAIGSRRDETPREREQRYEIERLERENQERREREDRDYERREREAKERRIAALPSNRLYNGEVGDPEEAMELHIAALVRENHGWDMETFDGQEFAKYWERNIASAQATLAEYRDRLKVAREAFEAAQRAIFLDFASSDDETRKNIGEACLEGDFSRLAI